MMTFYLLGILGVSILVWMWALDKAKQRGYQQGWKDAESWWVEQDVEVQKAREKMWMEEQ